VKRYRVRYKTIEEEEYLATMVADTMEQARRFGERGGMTPGVADLAVTRVRDRLTREIISVEEIGGAL
jgi:hypothetical protein